jgi:hypothetical protein
MSESPLRYLSQEACARLKREKDANLQTYLDGLAATLVSDADLKPSGIVPAGPTPELNDAQRRRSNKNAPLIEADNAGLVYDFLPNLTRLQASQPQLWLTLTHTHFAAYLPNRWLSEHATKPEKTPAKRARALRTRICGGSLQRQAIARLWWSAYLTRKPLEWPEFKRYQSADNGRYTKLLLRNLTFRQGLLERFFGRDERLLFASLDVSESVLDDPDIRNEDYGKAYCGLLNAALGPVSIGRLSTDDIHSLCMSRRDAALASL